MKKLYIPFVILSILSFAVRAQTNTNSDSEAAPFWGLPLTLGLRVWEVSEPL